MKTLFATVLLLLIAVSGYAQATNGGPSPLVNVAQTYYVCAKANGGTCVYAGDAGTVAAIIADTNNCTTKATPCRTIDGVRAKLAGSVIAAPVTIQLATTAGTGTDCYTPNRVVFENQTPGGSYGTALSLGSQTIPDSTYPPGYVYIKGDDTTPANVSIVGATTCTGTASSTIVGLSFLGMNARVSGVAFKYFKFAIQANHSTLFVEKFTDISDNPAPTVIDASAVVVDDRSVLHAGSTVSVTDHVFATVNGNSLFDTHTPAGYLILTYSSSGGERAMLMNEGSHGYNQGATYTFSGTGAYKMFQAIANSHWNWQTDLTTSFTFNAANATELSATQGSTIFETCGNALTPCTFTALGQRAVAQRGSTIQYQGTTAGSVADSYDTNSCIANGTFPYEWLCGGISQLTMVRDAAQMAIKATVAGPSTFQSLVINAQRAQGTVASPTVIGTADDLLSINGVGYDGANYISGGTIRFGADGTWDATHRPTIVEFKAHANDTSTNNSLITLRGKTGTVALGSGAAVASATAIVPTGNVFHVTGTVTITSVTATNVTAGTEITIIFDGVLTFTDGSNLKLAGNFTTTADDTITLIYDGTNWYEVARAVN